MIWPLVGSIGPVDPTICYLERIFVPAKIEEQLRKHIIRLAPVPTEVRHLQCLVEHRIDDFE